MPDGETTTGSQPKPIGPIEWLYAWWRCIANVFMYRTLAKGMLVLQLAHLIFIPIKLSIKSFVGLFTTSSAGVKGTLDRVRESRACAIDEHFLQCTENVVKNRKKRGLGWQGEEEDFVLFEDATPGSLLGPRTITAQETGVLAETAAQALGVLLAQVFDKVPRDSVSSSTELMPVSLLMHNSAEYFPLVLGISRSTVYANLCASRAGAESSTYIHSCGSLLNTNVPSSDMLGAALSTTKSPILVVEPSFVPLLLSRDGKSLSVPGHVRVILTWRASSAEDKSAIATLKRHCAQLSETDRWNSSKTVFFGDLHDDLMAGPDAKRSGLIDDPIAVVHRVTKLVHGAASTGLPAGLTSTSATKVVFKALGRFRLTDPMLMIFTSGTTGLPKAAKFSHLRFHGGCMLSKLLDPRKALKKRGDSTNVLTVYNCLPQYHSAGGVLCPCHLITLLNTQAGQNWKWYWGAPQDTKKNGSAPALFSARMVVRKKFSASQYVTDLSKYRASIAQYIGELLRYAVQATKEGQKADWITPIAMGNGCRADVWDAAKDRLGFGQMVEFYTSTEGNVGFVNVDDEPHAVGLIPILPQPFFRFSPAFWGLFPIQFVRYDPETEAPLRDPTTGRCSLVKPGEPAEVIGVVANGFDPLGLRRFDGYLHDDKSTSKKLCGGVFKKNDLYFRSGDLLRFDERGYVYFADRIGDTFRWKGENVSTLEVANAISRIPETKVGASSASLSIGDAIVFGVSVPEHEGKAGMVKLTLHVKGDARDLRSVATEFVESQLYDLSNRPAGCLHRCRTTRSRSSCVPRQRAVTRKRTVGSWKANTSQRRSNTRKEPIRRKHGPVTTTSQSLSSLDLALLHRGATAWPLTMSSACSRREAFRRASSGEKYPRAEVF